jgi:hypothetical protein
MFKRFTIAVAAALGLSAPAAAITLDFDTGVFTPTSYSQGGYVFALSSTGSNNGPNLFNTICDGNNDGGPDGCNGDIDLVPGIANTTGGNQGQDGISGNVIILQRDENGGQPNPNDDANGGTITFELVSGPSFRITQVSVVDDGLFSLSTNLDGQVSLLDLTADNETAIKSVTTSLLTIGDTFTLDYGNQSGGFDSIVLAPVPLPAGVWLLLAGLGGLIGLKRRARA